MDLKQYQIVIVNLDPTIGSEIRKTRPCVIISPNEMNKYLRTIVIAPLTFSDADYPTRVSVNFQNKVGRIAIDQIRTIDKARVVKVKSPLTSNEIENIKQTIKDTFVL